MPLLATVELHHSDGLVRDSIFNSFAFQTATDFPSSGEMDAVTAALEAFYRTTPTGVTRSVDKLISEQVSRTVKPTVRQYNILGVLNGGPHGSPIRVNDFASNLAAPSDSTVLPSELAACLSFHAAYGSDFEFGAGNRPRARDRGRVYLGPLTAEAVGEDATTHRGFVHANVRAICTAAALDLLNSATTDWCVWSRTAGVLKTVVTASMDDAFDVQRRRGERPTVKTTVP